MPNLDISGWQRVRPASKRVVIWGAGDQFRVNWPILVSQKVQVVAFIDQTPNLTSPVQDIPLFGTLNEFLCSQKDIAKSDIGSVICIGNPYSKERVEFSNLLAQEGFNPISFADDTSLIRESVVFDFGLQVMPRVLIHNDVRIGSNCIVNTSALIEHDCVIGSGVEIGPGAILTGRVELGDHAWIGAGAIILPRLKIGKGSIVGAGAVVTKDIPSNTVVVGSPAKAIK
jgi:sugar O-acyltransferase (sialic acid O-acetyltransferase NeuD family)